MYRGKLQKDLDLWVGQGLIARNQADSMLAELDGRRSSFSFGGVLMILAAVLIAAAILLIIASGWQEIPRVVKIGGVVALIWLFHLAAAILLSQGSPRIAAALLVLGSACFGGGIALVGQQYHLSGDAFDAMLVWFALTSVSAAVFRSGALTFFSGLLAWALFFTFLDEQGGVWSLYHLGAMLGGGAVVAALIPWTGAGRAQHFIYMLALALIFWFYTIAESEPLALGLAVTGAIILAAASLKMLPWHRFVSRAGAAPAFYGLVLALMGLALLHFDIEEGAPLALLALGTLGVCILALALCGRDNGAVRIVAYFAFAAEVLYLSFVTIDSMLGTSGFFLLSGFVVAIFAFVVVRLEKLFAARAKAAHQEISP